MYDPTLGRWFVPDPIDQFSDFSPYGFVLNDPMNLTDPDGRQVGVDGITKSVGVIKDAAGSSGFGWQVVGKRFIETPSAINNIGNAIGGFAKGVAKTITTNILALGTFGMLPVGTLRNTKNGRNFQQPFENMPLDNLGNRLTNGDISEKAEAFGEIVTTTYALKSTPKPLTSKPILGGLSVIENESLLSAQTKPYEVIGSLKGKRVGHTFSKHGSNNTIELQLQAKNSGKPQGQWINDSAAESIISENLDKLSQGAITIEIPTGIGRVVNPDGTFSPATHARLVPSGSGVKTAFPLIK